MRSEKWCTTSTSQKKSSHQPDDNDLISSISNLQPGAPHVVKSLISEWKDMRRQVLVRKTLSNVRLHVRAVIETQLLVRVHRHKDVPNKRLNTRWRRERHEEKDKKEEVRNGRWSNCFQERWNGVHEEKKEKKEKRESPCINLLCNVAQPQLIMNDLLRELIQID